MIGQSIGSYKITGLLGEGGMGTVYAAEHKLIGRKAALKVLLPDYCHKQDLVNRFFNEAKAATAIRHPGIIEIYDFGHHVDGSTYIVMEHLDGETLASRMRRVRPLPVDHAISLCRQIASALAAAHAQGIVHRDLKPDNVFICPDPDMPRGERAKLLDFGIAKLVDDHNIGSVKTRTGSVMGTPAYMSPEQCKGAGAVDHRSDLYALGCILYEMLGGRPPFLAEGSGEVMAQHIYEVPEPLSSVAADTSPELAALVQQLLAKDPADRPALAADLKERFDTLGGAVAGGHRRVESGEPTLATPAGRNPRYRGPPVQTTLSAATRVAPTTGAILQQRRSGVAVFISAVLLLVAGGVVFGLTRGGGDASNANGSEQGLVAAGEVVDTGTPSAIVELAAVDGGRAARTGDASATEATISPPVIDKIQVSVVSVPPGAKVYRMPSGAKVGVTPFEIRYQPVGGILEFQLRRAGYRTEIVEVPADQDSVRRVKLRKKSRPRPPKPKPDPNARLNPFAK